MLLSHNLSVHYVILTMRVVAPETRSPLHIKHVLLVRLDITLSILNVWSESITFIEFLNDVCLGCQVHLRNVQTNIGNVMLVVFYLEQRPAHVLLGLIFIDWLSLRPLHIW